MGTPNMKRTCLDMDSYLGKMNDRVFERRYRMSKTSFFGLLDIIKAHLPSTSTGERHGGGCPNGPISQFNFLFWNNALFPPLWDIFLSALEMG